MRSYRAAIFVLLGDIFKARAMLGSRSRAVKKPYGATSRMNVIRERIIEIYVMRERNFLYLSAWQIEDRETKNR